MNPIYITLKFKVITELVGKIKEAISMRILLNDLNAIHRMKGIYLKNSHYCENFTSEPNLDELLTLTSMSESLLLEFSFYSIIFPNSHSLHYSSIISNFNTVLVDIAKLLIKIKYYDACILNHISM